MAKKLTNAHLLKLNEELTAENARLLTNYDVLNIAYKTSRGQVDYLKDKIKKIENDLEMETHFKCNEKSIRRDLSAELTSIKSKWRYKLMTWGILK